MIEGGHKSYFLLQKYIFIQETFEKATVLAESLFPMDIEERIQTFGLSSPLSRKVSSKTRPSIRPAQVSNSPHKFPNVYPKIVECSSASKSPPCSCDKTVATANEAKFSLGSLVKFDLNISGFLLGRGLQNLVITALRLTRGKSGVNIVQNYETLFMDDLSRKKLKKILL